MRFLKTAITTYVILSACVLLFEVFHYSFIRTNFDGFGPGLLAFAMMCYVFPVVSIVVAAIAASKEPKVKTPPTKLNDADERNE